MSEYKFMQSVLTRHLIVVTIGGSSGGHFKGVCVTDCRSVYADYKIGEVRSDWIISAFTEITSQEAKDKYGLVLYRHDILENNVCCQTAPITDEDKMPVVFISGSGWKAGGRWNFHTYSKLLPIYDNKPTPESKVDWSEAPVWADAYGETEDGTPLWMGENIYKYVNDSKEFYEYGDGWGKDEIKIIENRPPRTIAQILGISSLSVNSEIAKNQKTVITTPKPTKTQRVINRAFEDIFATTVTFKNPEWGALLFKTIEPTLTYEQKLDLVCAVYGGDDDDEEHY
jgi:hypothetical protein